MLTSHARNVRVQEEDLFGGAGGPDLYGDYSGQQQIGDDGLGSYDMGQVCAACMGCVLQLGITCAVHQLRSSLPLAG